GGGGAGGRARPRRPPPGGGPAGGPLAVRTRAIAALPADCSDRWNQEPATLRDRNLYLLVTDP
uniref:hypothetical protein n=1 Tax=Nocardia abscessus TaxID=120957 RepID=UPI0024566D4E